MWAFASHYVLFGNYNSLLAFMPIFFRSKGLCYLWLLQRVLTSAVRAGLRVGAVVLKIFVLFEHAYFACFCTVFGHVYSYWHTCKYSFVATDFAILNYSKRVLTSAVRAGLRFGAVVLKNFALFEHDYILLVLYCIWPCLIILLNIVWIT